MHMHVTLYTINILLISQQDQTRAQQKSHFQLASCAQEVNNTLSFCLKIMAQRVNVKLDEVPGVFHGKNDAKQKSEVCELSFYGRTDTLNTM